MARRALGSERVVTDGAGAVTGSATYDPYGVPAAVAGSASTLGFGFAGEQVDATGLVHLRARQYDPTVGRFLTADSVQPNGPGTQGWNLYGYGLGNPVTNTDPSGHFAISYAQLLTIAVLVAAALLWLAYYYSVTLPCLQGTGSCPQLPDFPDFPGGDAPAIPRPAPPTWPGIDPGTAEELLRIAGEAVRALSAAAAIALATCLGKDCNAVRAIKALPVVCFVFHQMPAISTNVLEAVAFDGKPGFLHRETDRSVIRTQRRRTCVDFNGVDTCDEYPLRQLEGRRPRRTNCQRSDRRAAAARGDHQLDLPKRQDRRQRSVPRHHCSVSSVQKFEGFEAALPSGATVRESTKADPDGPRRTHRVDIDVGNERITVFATWRRGWVAVHLDWLALLEERLATPVQAIEGLERFPLERRGQLDRTVYVRQGMKPLGKYNACNADWVHDILIELDDQGQPSEAAAAVLDSFAPTPEVKVPIPPEALPSNEHLPRAVGLDAGGVVEFVAFLPVHRHVDLKDASETSDRDPGFADEPVGLWGWPSHWRFFAVGFGPTTFRLRWAISREEAMADAADWDHVVEAALALSTNRLAVIADTDQPDGQIEITLPASGQVGMVYRFRGEFDRVGSPEPQGEYEIVCYQPPSVWEPLVIVDSGLFRA